MGKPLKIKRSNVAGGRYVTLTEGTREACIKMLTKDDPAKDLKDYAAECRKKSARLIRDAEFAERGASQLRGESEPIGEAQGGHPHL
jgi:hypothetical protein